jgi:outer membrane protein TolC
MKPLPAMFLAALLPIVSSGASLPAPEVLESRLVGSRAMQLLNAEYEMARTKLAQDESANGLSLYSHTTFSNNDEVVDVGRTRSYRQLASGLGVRVPLLGSRMQWQQAVANRELDLTRLEVEHELRRRELQRDLRIAYVRHWGAQRLASLSRDFLKDEATIERGLSLRTRAGLLLDADRLEFMSGFSLARRDVATSEADEALTLQTLRHLVGGALDQGSAMRPMLGPSCTPTNAGLEAIVAAHPEVKYLEQAQGHAFSTRQDSALYGINSDLRIGYVTSTEWPIEQQGGSAAITWSFDVPIDFLNRRKLAQSSAHAARSHAQLEYEFRKEEIARELRAHVAQRAALEQSLRFATVRLAAADEAVRERELRAARLAGDVIEQLQQSRLARYNAEKGVLDAELALAKWTADWSMHAPSECQGRSLYVWSSGRTIDELANGSAASLDAFDSTQTNTLLLSLDGAQIDAYRKDPARLRAALDAAHRRGIKVELLLGEPTWLLPAERDRLLNIVRDLRALPFDGLHLDIEPDQLTQAAGTTETVWSEWLATVRAVRETSPWTLEVSMHPRYLDVAVEGRRLGEHLADLDVGVTLMIYVANPERVIAIAEPLLARYPELALRVALSDEDSLSPEESLHYVSSDERARRIALIEKRLAASNFKGVTIQPSRAPAPDLTAGGECAGKLRCLHEQREHGSR